MGARSAPEVREPLRVASLRLAAADADQLQPVRAGLERAHDGRRDAQHVPRNELDDLVAELGAAGAGDDDVGLLLLAMPVAPRHAGSRRVREAAHPELARVQGVAGEAPLHRYLRRAAVLE